MLREVPTISPDGTAHLLGMTGEGHPSGLVLLKRRRGVIIQRDVGTAARDVAPENPSIRNSKAAKTRRWLDHFVASVAGIGFGYITISASTVPSSITCETCPSHWAGRSRRGRRRCVGG